MGMSVQKKCICGFVLFTLLIGIFGFLIGFYARPRPDNQACNGAKNGDDASIWKSYEKEALAFVSAEQIRHYLMYFSNHSHLAGTNVSYAQAQYIEAEWKALGFDTVEMKRYDVLLSYPKRPSMVSLIDSSGTVVHLSVSTEHAPGVVFPYSAYSASGVVTGKLMYLNYGRESDFKYLDDININCSGKIVILRHGKIFSSQKAENAQRRGARGVILYPDPADYDYVRNETNHTYSEWFPNNTVQRGHVWTRNGDALTPGYPATAGIYREPVDKVPLIKIPVQPISYKDAELLLRILNQTMAPTKWQGGLGFIYRIQMAANDTRNVSVNVSLVLETRPMYNVVATIVGGTEPDRYVLLGNPRDAWTFGAVNPSSGSAVMMEVARSLQAIRKKGWRPRRTIKLCSWGAKEFGVIGSGEWVEEYGKVLAARAVAYINVESAVEGTFAMKVKSSPLLVGAAFNVAKKVAVPLSSSESLYEEWKRKVTNGSEANPRVSSVFGESDSLFFAYNIGVPCIDLGYRRDNTSSAYPVQHSIHDTFHWLETFVDPTLAYHKALAQVWLQLTFDIAGSVLIPFDLNRYAEDIDAYSNELWEYYNNTLNNNNITLEFLLNSAKDFIVAAKEFKDFLNKLDKNNVLQVRMANDRLLQLNRAFIAKDGLLGRPSLRHVVLAPSIFNTEAGNKFPGISDSIYIARKSDKREDWEQVKKEVSVVVHAVRSAISVIRPVNS